MNTKLTRFLLPLAAITLATVACDPFPAKPGGDPVVVRVTTHGPGGDSNTVETVTNGGTVVTDFAWVDDTIHIQFNKPMDGSTIQRFTNYETAPADPAAAGLMVAPVDPGATPPRDTAVDLAEPYPACTVPTNLTLTGFPDIAGAPWVYDFATHDFVPGSGSWPVHTRVCYEPNSPTDGGQLVIYPASPLVYGTVYGIAGTVKDYEGKSIAIDVTITVDQRPLPWGYDGYTLVVDWFDSGADSYELLQGPAAAGPWASFGALLPVDFCDAGRVQCQVAVTELVPNTEYFYQVKETTGATTITRPAVLGAVSTLSPLRPSFGVATTPTPPITVIPGVIRVAWGAVLGANGYDLETSTDGATWTPVTNMTARAFYAGTPLPGTTAPTSGPGTLTPGTTYWFRVTPTFASGFAAQKGTPASSVSP